MSQPADRFIGYVSSALFIAGLIAFVWAAKKFSGEAGLIITLLGGAYFLAYGKIEQFVRRSARPSEE